MFMMVQHYHERSGVLEAGMESPWKELMKESTASPHRDSVFSGEEDISSTSSESESDRTSSSPQRTVASGRSASEETRLSPGMAPTHPPYTTLTIEHPANSTRRAEKNSLSLVPKSPDIVVARAVVGKEGQESAPVAHRGLSKAGLSTTDTERFSPVRVSSEGGVKVGSESNSRLSEDGSRAGEVSSNVSRVASREKIRARCNGEKQTRENGAGEEALTSDSGEEVALDQAVSDSLLLESLVDWVVPSTPLLSAPFSRVDDGASSGAASPSSRDAFRLFPKVCRVFSGDDDRESNAAVDAPLPLTRRLRRRQSQHAGRRSSRKKVENQTTAGA